MAQGVEWVGPAASPEEPSRVPPEVQEEVRELRDQVRRLQEQVNALAARPKAGGRIPTHVAGLDAALEGGIPRGHVVLLAGPTGAMKTSLALYAVVKNRAAGARGLYVTIEEGRDSLIQTMRRLGLSEGDEFLVDVARLRLERTSAEDVRDWMRVLRDYLARRHEREALGLVVIDSLNALLALAPGAEARGELFTFFTFLRSLGATSILVEEQDPAAPRVDPQASFLADGVLELRFSGAGEGRVQLLLRCAKMRHTRHSRDYFVLHHDGKRFVANPYEAPRGRRWGRRG